MSLPSRPSRLVPLIVACALFMENLDSTALTTALPAIAHSFGENPLHLSLAISSYLVSLAVFIPLSGWVADRYGARRVFRGAIVLFTVGSLLCGISHGIAELIGARMIQGIGGAMMVPVGRLLVLRRTPKAELVTAMAYVVVPALIAPVVGPPIGGLIATYSSWRWIFFINIPIGIIGYVLVTIFIREADAEGARPLDLRGWAVLALGLASAVLGFENLGKGLVSDQVVFGVLAVGALLTVVYVLRSRRQAHPILDLSLLRIATFRASVAGGSLFRIGIGAYTLLMPLMLQEAFGLTPLRSGLLTFAGAIGALTMRAIASRMVRRFGFRQLLTVNTLIASGLLMACGLFTQATPHLLVVALVLVMGFSRSLQFTCVNSMGFADVSQPAMSQATSFSGTAQQLALSMGVGIAAQVLHLSTLLRGSEQLQRIDFSVAFFVVGLISALSFASFVRLPADAGSSVSGHSMSREQE